MEFTRFDHVVFTVENIERTVEFYKGLGMTDVIFGESRRALLCGRQKINLHEKGKEFEPKANHPTPGAIDLCVITSTRLDIVTSELEEKGIEIIEGPVERTGAQGKINSIYIRDPDQNLIEISNHF